MPGIETGWFQREIGASALRQQEEIDSGRRVVVGLNHFTEGSEKVEIDTLRIDPEVEDRQCARMAHLRDERDAEAVESTLRALTAACRDSANVLGPMLECARADCTLYEIRAAMETVFGFYKEPVTF